MSDLFVKTPEPEGPLYVWWTPGCGSMRGPGGLAQIKADPLKNKKNIDRRRMKYKSCGKCFVCSYCKGNIDCEICEMCTSCLAAIKKNSDSYSKSFKQVDEWEAYKAKGGTKSFNEFTKPKPKRKANKPRKSNEEKIWDEIVKADGRPLKERENQKGKKISGRQTSLER